MKVMRTLSGMVVMLVVSVGLGFAFNPIELIPVTAAVGAAQSTTTQGQGSLASDNGTLLHVNSKGEVISSEATVVNQPRTDTGTGKLLLHPLGDGEMGLTPQEGKGGTTEHVLDSELTLIPTGR